MRAALISIVLLAACQSPHDADSGAVTPAGLPQTVSIPLGSDAEEIAARECGAPVRPETVHHESNVITFRCLREGS